MKRPKSQIPNPNHILSRKFQIRLLVTHCWGRKIAGVLLLASWCLALFLAGTARAQNFTIDWFSIDGGGGTSTGGVFAVTGTIGQPDAGRISGGNFTMDGGFWGIIAAVQSAGAPTLAILRTSTNTVMVYWPSPSAGFNLQENTNGVANANWSNVTVTPVDTGAIKYIIINPPTGNRFYRLIKP